MVLGSITLFRHNVIVRAVTMYNPCSRIMAHALKGGKWSTVLEAAYMMAPMVPRNAVLIPMPSHSGHADAMLKLASAISWITGAPVMDVLQGKRRRPVYDMKKCGKRVTADSLGYRLTASLPEGKVAVVVDNVCDTGVNAFAAANAIGGCVLLTYAVTSKMWLTRASR